MTEKELYRKTFDEVAASGMRKLEVCDIMNNVRVTFMCELITN